MFDGKEATCWNSDQGLPQHVTIKFDEPQKGLCSVRYISQGGFCPKVRPRFLSRIQEVTVHLDGRAVASQEMEDSNFEQTISFARCEEAVATVKVEFTRASDLFGRIIMYKFEVLTS